jgi:hypothetical protein
MKFHEEATWRPRPVFCCLRSEFRRKERRHSPHEAARNLPTTVRGEIDYCWGGLVDMCKDRYPRAGHVDGVCMRWAIPAMAPTDDPTWHDHHRYDSRPSRPQSSRGPRLAGLSRPFRQAVVPAACRGKRPSTDFSNPDAATNEKGAGMISRQPFSFSLQSVRQARRCADVEALDSRYSSMPHWAASRPRPDCLMPPNDATSVELLRC